MSNTGYKEAYSEISSQQQKIEQAKKQLREQKLSVPERIRQREAIRASPRYRESAKRQEISRQKALSEISEEGKSLKEQLEAIEKYEKEGYEIKKTPKGYEFLKKIKGEPKYKAVTKKVVDTSSKKYIEITNEISDVNKRINNLQKMQKAAPNESIKKALGNTIDFWKKKKSKLLKDRQKYKKVTTAKKEVDTWETLTGVVEGKSVSGVPTYSPIYDVARKAETRLAEERLDEIEEPSTTTRLVAAGFTPETYESVGEVTIGAPEAGLPYKTFKASEQPYEKIPEYYESIPKIQAEKLREVEEAKQQKMISSLPSSIRTAVTSRTITTPEGKKAIIPTLPDFYKSADGEDILGMGIEYERIMKSVISNNISNEKATDLLTKKLNEKLSKANEDTLIKWLGYNPNTPYPAGESKKIFLNPIIAQDIANYTQTYNLIKSYADKGYYKGSATKQVKEILTGTNKRQDAKKWISNNLTPEEYSDINLSKEGSFVDFQTYKNYHPDRRAVVLNIDTKGKDLSSIFKPTVSYKAADKEEWERLGKTYVLPEWLRPLEVGASIIIGKTLGQEEAITPAQLSKAFVVGGTQWPRTIWSAASAIPPAIESGDYVKEYRAQLEPQLYEAGYRISEAATRGHKTGDWTPYALEMATSPAMTDVVYPLAIGAGFSAAGSKIGSAGGRIAKGVSKVSSGVTKTISKKLPTVASKLSKVGVTPANIRKVGFGIGRRVGTPYGMTTIFMAPSAAEMGWATGKYHKGELSREQWIQSLQRGSRTGFQLGMFSAGASYKPSEKALRVSKKIFTPKAEVVSVPGYSERGVYGAKRYVFEFPKGKPRLRYGRTVPVEYDVSAGRILRRLSPEELASRLKPTSIVPSEGIKGFGYTRAYDVGTKGFTKQPPMGKGVVYGSGETGFHALPERATPADISKFKSERGITRYFKPKVDVSDIPEEMFPRTETGDYLYSTLTKEGYPYSIPDGVIGDKVVGSRMGRGIVGKEEVTRMFGPEKIGGEEIKVVKKLTTTEQTKLYKYGEMYPIDVPIYTKQPIRRLMPEMFPDYFSYPKVPTVYKGPYQYLSRKGGLFKSPSIIRGKSRIIKETSLDKYGLEVTEPKKTWLQQTGLDDYGAEIPEFYKSETPFSDVAKKMTRKRAKYSDSIKGYSKPRKRLSSKERRGSRRSKIIEEKPKSLGEIREQPLTRYEVIGDDAVKVIRGYKKSKPFKPKPGQKVSKPGDQFVKTSEGTISELRVDTKEAAKSRKIGAPKKSTYKTRQEKMRKLNEAKRNVFTRREKIKQLEEELRKTPEQLTLEGKKVVGEPKPREIPEIEETKISKIRPKTERKLFEEIERPKRIEHYRDYYEPLTEVKYEETKVEYPSASDFPGRKTKYPMQKEGYAEAYGYRGEDYAMYEEPVSSYWQGKSPYFEGPKGPRFNTPKGDLAPGVISFRMPVIIKETGKATEVGSKGLLGTQEALGGIYKKRIDMLQEPIHDYDRITDMMRDTALSQKQSPYLDQGLKSKQKQQLEQDLLSPQITAEVPKLKTPPRHIIREEKPIKFRLPLPDDDEKKKFYRRGGRTARGLGYKERFYKVKGFELGKNKPKYINIIK